MNEPSLQELIKGCKNKNRSSQRALFMLMYNYGMSIAARYCDTKQDKEEIAHDAFYKMLNKIDTYKEEIPFKLWLRRIVINTGIDFVRKNKIKYTALEEAPDRLAYNKGEEQLFHDHLLKMLSLLSPQYRLVFVLHVIEGFSHEEISKQLEISLGTSKSNLFKARKKLRMIITELEKKEKYVRSRLR